MGHARALLSLDALHQIGAAEQITSRGLSVRQTEALVRQLQSGHTTSAKPKRAEKDPDTRLLETRLSDQIGAPVAINADQKGGGQLVIRYSSLEELDGILEHLR
jgi:ParB family chromosome partitioning protein